MAPSEATTPGAVAEPARAVRLGDADVFAGVALSDAAGWNQTADDWALFARHGVAFGRRTARSELVATAAVLPYGPLAWISMVLVGRDWRHRGLASGLLREALEHLGEHGLTPVLDATPAGQAVYERLGFRPGFAFRRWSGEAGRHPASAVDRAVRPAGRDDEDALAPLDRNASGLARGLLLRDLLIRRGTRAWMWAADGNPSAFVIAREGRRAWQLGPLVAPTSAQAQALLQTALAELDGPVFIDVPDAHAGLRAWLGAHGFTVQRPFVRMARAQTLPDCVTQPSAHLFAVAGPEFG